jgi:hypothetical protein
MGILGGILTIIKSLIYKNVLYDHEKIMKKLSENIDLKEEWITDCRNKKIKDKIMKLFPLRAVLLLEECYYLILTPYILWFILKKEAFIFLDKEINQNTIDQKYLIISPSDFGFHNIIIKKNVNYFIDFEFSGWDDPAKLYCDFILQPKFPIPSSFHPFLKEQLLGKEYISQYDKRIDLLYDLLKFKWLTIKYTFLNENKFKLNQFNHLNLLNLNSKEYINELH